MTTHYHPPGTPEPADRGPFLIDGCERCEEYAWKLGAPFDVLRWQAFWNHMIDIEFGPGGVAYASQLDAKLGGQLYLVALGMQRAWTLTTEQLRHPGRRRA